MTTYAPPKVTMIPARWAGGHQTPRTIVIHGTVSPCARGGARSVANFFANRPATGKTSAHYTVDPYEVIASVGDHTVAFHCGHNQDSIGIELCDPQAGRKDRWQDNQHTLMLARAATLVAQLCLAYDIPAIRVLPSALVVGKHGICGHVDMSHAFHASTHTDPGPDFPWTDFIHQVKAEVARLSKESDMPQTANELRDAALVDLRAVAKDHGVSLVYLARVALFGASAANKGGRLARIAAARATLKGMA